MKGQGQSQMQFHVIVVQQYKTLSGTALSITFVIIALVIVKVKYLIWKNKIKVHAAFESDVFLKLWQETSINNDYNYCPEATVRVVSFA